MHSHWPSHPLRVFYKLDSQLSEVFTNDCDADADIELIYPESESNLDSEDIVGLQAVRKIKFSLSDYQDFRNAPRMSLIDGLMEFEQIESQSDLMICYYILHCLYVSYYKANWPNIHCC